MGRGINTALGDAVNVAFSIESLTRALGRPILSSVAFLDGWEHGRDMFESCGAQPIKGHVEALEVFAVKDLTM
jgi:adenylate cyclase